MHALRRPSDRLSPGAFAAPGLGQQWVNPRFDTHRWTIRDLGYPTQNLIPADNSRITALLAHSNGFVYGATSGRTQSYLFFYNRFINKVRPLGRSRRPAASTTACWRARTARSTSEPA